MSLAIASHVWSLSHKRHHHAASRRFTFNALAVCPNRQQRSSPDIVLPSHISVCLLLTNFDRFHHNFNYFHLPILSIPSEVICSTIPTSTSKTNNQLISPDKMGAWALSLFCCDYDLDLLQDLDQKCGLPALERAAGRQPRPGSNSGTAREGEHARIAAMSNISPEARQKLPINYSMLEKLCSDPVKVRAHLDNTGILARVFTDLKRQVIQVQRSFLRDPYGPGYHICILGACAMTLGARISANDRVAMSRYFAPKSDFPFQIHTLTCSTSFRYYRSCGLMRDAVTQLEHALDPDTGYVNGCPWDFGILGRDDVSAPDLPKKEDALFPGFLMLNVWSPDHGRDKGEKWIFRKAILHTIATCKPGVDDLAQSLASLMFDPYETAKTRISSTKADSHPEKYRIEAERLVRLYDFHTRPAGMQESSDQKCGSCGKETKLSKCGKCQEVYYCDRTCQKADFAKHKVVCPLLTRLKVEQDFEEELSAFAKEVKKRGG